MGYAVCAILVRGQDSASIHASLGVRETGQHEEVPESPVVGASLPSGWYLIFINDRRYPSTSVLEALSTSGDLVYCEVEEHVMVSSASGWKEGRETWAVTHDAQRSIDHLETSGLLPDEFAAIADALRARQRAAHDADYMFEIPVEVTRSLTGFRYDGNPDGYPVEQFEVLQRVAGKRWWEFWR